jgi:hypothetical protein
MDGNAMILLFSSALTRQGGWVIVGDSWEGGYLRT